LIIPAAVFLTATWLSWFMPGNEACATMWVRPPPIVDRVLSGSSRKRLGSLPSNAGYGDRCAPHPPDEDRVAPGPSAPSSPACAMCEMAVTRGGQNSHTSSPEDPAAEDRRHVRPLLGRQGLISRDRVAGKTEAISQPNSQ